MKIKVKDLLPNPYRKMEKYPVDRHKVAALENSISQTSFWDNLVARPAEKNGKYELAYGHHRWIALQNLGVKKIEIPVRDLDDGTMIQIMANENLDQWKMTPAVINETVRVAKEYLDGELAKYDSWGELKSAGSHLINLLNVKRPQEFAPLRKKGVGQTTLLKFLGKNWKQWQIQQALDNITSDDIDREAIEQTKTGSEAEDYKRALRNAKVPLEKQKEVIRKTKPIVDKMKAKEKEQRAKAKEEGAATPPDHPAISTRKKIERAVDIATGKATEENVRLKDIEGVVDKAMQKTDEARAAYNTAVQLLKEAEVEEVTGLKQFFALGKIKDMLSALDRFADFFGISLKRGGIK